MIVFPPEFVKTRYTGYFWNVDEKVLYSIKGGELKPLLKKPGYRGYNKFSRSFVDVPPRFVVSVNGVRRAVSDKYLESLTKTVNELQVVDVA